MSEMVERVARKLAEQNKCSPVDWKFWADEARELMTEMFDPTQEMIDAGRRSVSVWLDIGHGVEAQREKYKIRWNAMLKQAIGTPPRG